MKIGVIGGSGPAGRGLVARLASLGYDVVLGSRSQERGVEVRDELIAEHPQLADRVTGGENGEAAACELVVIATKWDATVTSAAQHADALAGKTVISMANALMKVGKDFQPLIPPRGSIAANVQAVLPNSHVVATFQHLPAAELGDIAHDINCDIMVCGDHKAAVEQVMDVVAKFPGARAIDAGSLSSALAIEAFTALMIQINVRYKTRVSPRLEGINGDPRAVASGA